LSKLHTIVLGGLHLVPHHSGALFVPEFNTTIIADLHLEQGTSLARRGLYVPPYDTAISLNVLQQVLAETKPQQVIFLGDTFHDAQADQRLEANHIEKLNALTKHFKTYWICGNHDPEPPKNIGGTAAQTMLLGAINLRHVPTQNLENEFEIAGHLHPGCGVNQRGRRIYGKCFISDERRLIMPAFGAYTGGLNISSDAFAGLFNKKAAQALMIGSTALHRFPAAKLNLF
jgi:uncharacterized protein